MVVIIPTQDLYVSWTATVRRFRDPLAHLTIDVVAEQRYHSPKEVHTQLFEILSKEIGEGEDEGTQQDLFDLLDASADLYQRIFRCREQVFAQQQSQIISMCHQGWLGSDLALWVEFHPPHKTH